MLKGLQTEADDTAMTTEHYGTGAAHYDHLHLATSPWEWLFPTGNSNSELEAAAAG